MKQNQKWIIQLKISQYEGFFLVWFFKLFFLNQDKPKVRIHFPEWEWKKQTRTQWLLEIVK